MENVPDCSRDTLNANSNEESITSDRIAISKEKFSDDLKITREGMSQHGNLFQLKLLMLVLWRAIESNFSMFRLATELPEGEKFDDIIFQYRKKSNWKFRLLQAKHKESTASKISRITGLFGSEGDAFSIQKYFKSYLKIKQRCEKLTDYSIFSNSEIEDVIIITNADFESKSLRKYFCEGDLETDEILRIGKVQKKKIKKATIYHVKDPSMDSEIVKKCLLIFENTSDYYTLIESLVEGIVKEELTRKKESIIKEYYYALVNNLFEIEQNGKKSSARLKWKKDIPFINNLVEEVAFVTLFDGKKIKISADFSNKGLIQNLQDSASTSTEKIPTLEELAEEVVNDIKNERELDQSLIIKFKKLHVPLDQEFLDVDNKTFLPIFIYGNSKRNKKLSDLMKKFRRTFIKCLLTEEQKQEVTMKFEGKELKILEKLANKFVPIHEPIIQDPSVFAEKMQKLISDNKDTKLIKINEETPWSIRNNLQMLSGHLIAKKYGKIRFCSSFVYSNQLPESLKEFKQQLAELLGEDFKEIYQYEFQIGFDFVTCEDGSLDRTLPVLHHNDDIIEFFHKLKFVVNYPNRMDINDLLERNIREKFKILDGKAFNSMYIEGMHDWMANRIGSFLTPNQTHEMFTDITNNLSLWTTNGIAKTYFADVSNELQFLDSNCFVEFLSNENQVMVIISENLQLTRIRIVQTFLNLQRDDTEPFMKYTRGFGHVFFYLKQFANLQFRSHISDQIENNTELNLIVIECNAGEENSELCEQFFDLISANEEIKVVLITTDGKIVTDVGDDTEQIDNDECNFDDLTDASKLKCLSKEITFQGETTTFNDILDIKKVGDVIGPDILSRIANKEEVSISCTPLLQEGYQEEYYVERNINNHIYVDLKILNDTDDIVVVDEHEEEFKKNCSQFPERNIHWFKKKVTKSFLNRSEVLSWQETKGSISNVLKYRLNENEINEELMEEYQIMNIETDIVIISDPAGMGKSTLLSSLTKKIKSNFKDHWLLRIDLNNCTNVLSEELRTNKCDKSDLKWANNLLEKMLSCSPDTKLNTEEEKKLLYHSFFITKKVILLLDAIDEISPNYTKIIIEFILALRDYQIEKIVITTRPNVAMGLETELNLPAFSLETFSETSQLNFLVKFWKKNFLENISHSYNENIEARLKIYAKNLIEKVSTLVDNEQESFTGIPLQLMMLAKDFQNADHEQEYQGCFQFLMSNETEPKLPDKISLFDLYTMFIQEKYRIYSKEKKKEDESNLYVEQDKETLYKKYRKQHCRLALYSFFDQDDLKLLLSDKKYNKPVEKIENFIKDIEIGKERGGLIVQVVNNRPKFVHRTFMEYFVAEFIVDSIVDHNNNTNRAEFIIKSVLTVKEYKIVRSFVNNLLWRQNISQSEFYGETMNSLWKLDENFISEPINCAIDNNNQHIVRFLLGCLKNYTTTRTRTYKKIYLSRLCNNLDLIKLFVENDYDVNNTDIINNTLLHYACMRNYLAKIKWLVKQEGIDMNLKNEKGRTPLHEMMYRSTEYSLEILKVLVESGADVTTSDPKGLQPLHYAAREGRIDLAEFLLDNNADINCTDCSGKTILHIATKYEQIEFCRWLLDDCKIDVDSRTTDGMTPLHLAVECGYTKVITMLLNDYKADVNSKTKFDSTPLHYAIKNSNVELIKLLIESGKADVNPKTKRGYTPLHLATENGNVAITKMLLNDYHADVNSKTKEGYTPLHLAVQGSNTELIKILIDDHNASVDPKTAKGYTPLHIAVINNKIDLCKLLIEQYRADVNSESLVGFTPLLVAVQNNNMELIKMLIDDYEVNVNCKTKNDFTPLHYAVENGNVELIKLLIENGQADVNPKTKRDYYTPLHLAIKSGNVEVTRMLLNDYKADVQCVTGEGHTVFFLSLKYYNTEIFDMLELKKLQNSV